VLRSAGGSAKFGGEGVGGGRRLDHGRLVYEDGGGGMPEEKKEVERSRSET
jgi:hypothetical protein